MYDIDSHVDVGVTARQREGVGSRRGRRRREREGEDEQEQRGKRGQTSGEGRGSVEDDIGEEDVQGLAVASFSVDATMKGNVARFLNHR